MELIYIFAIIFNHWVADFVFQDEKWAHQKSKSNKELLKHTVTYSLLLSPLAIFLGWNIIPFILINFILHTITDYFTSRHVSKQFAKGHLGGAIPNFGAFTSIGFDQVIHYICLFSSFMYFMP